jgi:hypothetical protein
VIILSTFIIKMHYNFPRTFSYTLYKNFLFVVRSCKTIQEELEDVFQTSVFLDPLFRNTMTSLWIPYDDILRPTVEVGLSLLKLHHAIHSLHSNGRHEGDWCKHIAYTFSYATDLDCVTSEKKSIVTRQNNVGYLIPNNNEIHLTGKAGFGKIDISRLGP